MPINRVTTDKHSATEGYEQDININADYLDARGSTYQNDTSNDATVFVSRDAANNLTFTDPVLGATKTLSQLASASSSVSYYEFLLDNEPVAETGATDASYANTFTAGKLTQEVWTRNDTTKIKQLDYTYTGSQLTTEVRKAYAADGTTVMAQVTWTYTYTGNALTSASMTRDV